MKQNKMKNVTFILLLSLGLLATLTTQAPRYLMEEYDEDYNYINIKQATNAGAHSEKKFPPVSLNYIYSYITLY